MNKMMEALKAHPSALVGLLGAALIAGVAFALSTQPLVPRGGGAGSAGSTPAVAGSSAGSARASSPAPDETGPDDAVGDTAGGGEGDAPAEDPAGEAKTQAGSPADKGGSSQGGASAAKPSKPSSGGSAGGTTQKPKPSHTHSWQAVYRTEPVYSQQWVSKWEDVYKGTQICWECSACHKRFYSDSEIDSHVWDTYGDAQHPNGASAIDQSYEIWEKEDHGSYQNVQTGTRQVLDHYECACGARK